MKLKNKTYDTLKYIVTIALPATEALWLTLGKIWSFPYVVEIGATIAAITVFFGALLGISSYQHNKPYPIDIEGLPYIDDEEVKAEEV